MAKAKTPLPYDYNLRVQPKSDPRLGLLEAEEQELRARTAILTESGAILMTEDSRYLVQE
jgi:hypothetical protein